MVCQLVDGQVRIVGLQSSMIRSNVEAWSHLPYLFGLEVAEEAASADDFSGLALPKSLRVATFHLADGRSWAKFASLLRAQGLVRSVFVLGNQQVKRWLKLDLSELCGLDLIRFTGFVIDVVGSAIPPCWSKMTSLSSFYCTNCMMTSPPTALRGLQSLRSFVAFRQSEMVPCALGDLAEDPARCKASWETTHASKEGGRRDSTGRWSDFQEGPSFSCPESSYAFPFKEFLDLGWTGIRKVWLDGNFLTGPIPSDIADAWPSLQSLDLYGNKMEGPLPESLGRLDVIKLQLQSNNFSGEVPRGLISKLSSQNHLTLGLSGNPELRGCLPRDLWGPGVGGTQVKRCDYDHDDL